MLFSFLNIFVAVLASVHSLITFVAASQPEQQQQVADPRITAAPSQAEIVKRQAGSPNTPILSTLLYSYSALPEQVYPFPVLRGPQFGYNICNSTTQGNASLCQTLIVNSAVRLFLSLFPY